MQLLLAHLPILGFPHSASSMLAWLTAGPLLPQCQRGASDLSSLFACPLPGEWSLTTTQGGAWQQASLPTWLGT